MKKCLTAIFMAMLSVSLIFTSCSLKPHSDKPMVSGSEKPTISADLANMDFSFTDRDENAAYDASDASFIVLSDSGSRITGAGTTLALCDRDGRVVVSFASPKTCQSAVITAPGINVGGSYLLMAGVSVSGADENGYAENTDKSGGTVLAEIEMTSSLYGSSGGQMGPGGSGGFRPR